MNHHSEQRIEQTLNRLHADASKDYMRMGKGIVKSIFSPPRPVDFEKAYLPISKEQGITIKKLLLDNNCKNIVEFGTSFGISTIYLAHAASQTGGKVVTTELLESKAKTAEKNITEAGLEDYVEIKVGDAMQTLKAYNNSIDFLFLDGWKDLYLPLFQILAPLFHKGTLIYADNMDMDGTKPYADYILQHKDKYNTQPINGGKGFLTTLA